jgi:hypothetical protein
MICQDCGVEAETKFVSFHQNMGLVFVRLPSSVEGRLCKSCIHKHFWRMTTVTFLVGWWGIISFIVTPFILLNNILRYLFCLRMAPTPADAKPVQLTDTAIEQIQPYTEELFGRLNEGEDFAAVLSAIAERAGVTPGQVALFVHAVVQSKSDETER